MQKGTWRPARCTMWVMPSLPTQRTTASRSVTSRRVQAMRFKSSPSSKSRGRAGSLARSAAKTEVPSDTRVASVQAPMQPQAPVTRTRGSLMKKPLWRDDTGCSDDDLEAEASSRLPWCARDCALSPVTWKGRRETSGGQGACDWPIPVVGPVRYTGRPVGRAIGTKGRSRHEPRTTFSTSSLAVKRCRR